MFIGITRLNYFKQILILSVGVSLLVLIAYIQSHEWQFGLSELLLGIIIANLPLFSAYLWYRNTSLEPLGSLLKVCSYLIPAATLLAGLLLYYYVYQNDLFTLWSYLYIPIIQIAVFWILTSAVIWLSVFDDSTVDK